MARSPKGSSPRLSKASSSVRRLTIQLTAGQCVVCGVVLMLCFAGVFVAGVLVGRGRPDGSSPTIPVPEKLARLLALDRQPPTFVPQAADTWVPAEKILDTLEFEESMRGTKASSTSGPAPTPKAESKEPATLSGESPASPAPETGTYVLMIASMRHKENATSLVERLKKKGYAPDVERVVLSEGNVWFRVTLGSFATREEALNFAARFNKEENLKALVIRKEGPKASD